MSHGADCTAIVTGGGSGFGREIALGLADAGLNVAVIGESGAESDTAAELESLGARSAGITSALDSRASAVAAFSAATDAIGRPDLVVHASVGAAALAPCALHELDDSGFDAACELEIRRALFCLQAAHDTLRGDGGRIVLVTPTLALMGAAHRVAFSTACEAQRSLVKSAARQWGTLGITVNIVAPALDTVLRAEHRDESADSHILADVPLGHTGEARADVAPVVALLAQPAGRFVTGQTLRIDGGSWLAG